MGQHRACGKVTLEAGKIYAMCLCADIAPDYSFKIGGNARTWQLKYRPMRPPTNNDVPLASAKGTTGK